MKEIKYNVIWVDDEWTKMSAFKDECEIIHGIHLEPFTTQKSGMEELDRHLNSWDAVILDAKMFDESENETPKLDGLRKAIRHIEQLSLKKSIPYFISTGQTDLMTNDTFCESFGHFYVKETDDLKLIDDLKKAIDSTPRRQVQVLYNDAFEQLAKISPNAKDTILEIFEAMHYPDSNPGFNPILYYTKLRQILEDLFRVANKFAIIPDICISKTDEVNINQCCHYLSGNDAQVLWIRYGKKGDRIVPKHIQDMMFLVLTLGNTNSHTTKDNTQKNVWNSKYLIFSLALQVCEIVMWMNKYMEEHPDIESNSKMCNIIDSTCNNQEENADNQMAEGILEPVEDIPYLYHIGTNCCIADQYMRDKKLIGKKVKVKKQESNNYNKTKDRFPYFAKGIEAVL